MIEIYCDGSTPENPGNVGYPAFIVKRDDVEIKRSVRTIKGMANDDITCNISEYLAMEDAADYVVESGLNEESITFYSDSRLVIRQLQKRWKIKKPHLRKIADSIWKKLYKIKKYELVWIPRERNTEADELSKSLWQRW